METKEVVTTTAFPLADCSRQFSSDGAFRQEELLRQDHHVPLFLQHDRLWSTQREQPLGLREQPQVQLGTAKVGLDAMGMLHLSDLLLVIVAGFIGGLGVIVIGIGLLFTLPYAFAVTSNLYGQFCQLTQSAITPPT